MNRLPSGFAPAALFQPPASYTRQQTFRGNAFREGANLLVGPSDEAGESPPSPSGNTGLPETFHPLPSIGGRGWSPRSHGRQSLVEQESRSAGFPGFAKRGAT